MLIHMWPEILYMQLCKHTTMSMQIVIICVWKL